MNKWWVCAIMAILSTLAGLLASVLIYINHYRQRPASWPDIFAFVLAAMLATLWWARFYWAWRERRRG